MVTHHIRYQISSYHYHYKCNYRYHSLIVCQLGIECHHQLCQTDQSSDIPDLWFHWDPLHLKIMQFILQNSSKAL